MPHMQPIRARHQYHVLNPSEIDVVRSGTLDILERVGVHFGSKRALETFADHGASVNWENGTVRLPPDLVVRSMDRAPRQFELAGRAAGTTLCLDGTTTYFGTADCGMHAIDMGTREERLSCKADVSMMARVADYLPSIAFYWPLVSAQEYGDLACLYDLEASLTNTVKHIQTQTLRGAPMARYAIQMGEIVAGSKERLRLHPPFSIVVCTISPLGHDEEGVEAAMAYAEAGIPVGFMSLPTLGSTAPATPGGALIMGSAEVVSGAVLLQLVAPGAPVFYSLSASVMDPRTAAYLVGMPQRYLCNSAAIQIAHSWGVPALGSVFNADSPKPSTWRLGRDSVYNALMVSLAGAEMAQGLGMLRGSTLLVPEQIIFDDEIYHMTRIVAEGIDLGTDGTALDVITAVGPRGHFLLEKHTREHTRKSWIPQLSYPRLMPDSPVPDIQDRARAILETILSEHSPQALPGRERRELEAVLNAAKREFEPSA